MREHILDGAGGLCSDLTYGTGTFGLRLARGGRDRIWFVPHVDGRRAVRQDRSAEDIAVAECSSRAHQRKTSNRDRYAKAASARAPTFTLIPLICSAALIFYVMCLSENLLRPRKVGRFIIIANRDGLLAEVTCGMYSLAVRFTNQPGEV